MKKQRKVNQLLVPIITGALILGACSQLVEGVTSSASQEASTAETTSGDSQSSSESYGTYEDEDLETDYDEAEATIISLSDKGTEASEGVTVDGSTVTINQAGTYVIEGSLSDGQLQVSVGAEDKVNIIFNGVSIHNEDGPAVNITEGEKVVTTLASGTTNTLSDGTEYNLETNETEPDATFYSKADLVINGDGELVVEGNYSNGIRSKDDLILVSGTYNVTAVNNALKGKDAVAILDGNYTLTTSEGDGIQANNEEDEDSGNVYIDGGSFDISSGRDGIQAVSNLAVQNATINIQTAEGASSTNIDTEESYKGLKAIGDIVISSGSITVDSADDAIHANNTIDIQGGEFTLASGDDGMHADTELTISDGTIDIQESYEGIESSIINITGGDINVVASDDGLNAGGGSDTEETTGTFGEDSFGQGGMPGGNDVDESKELNITGGNLVVDAEGDGLDSNGVVNMSGGLVIVNGPTTGGNGALDYGSSFEVTGGTLIATGTTDMAQNISGGSQNAIGISYDESQEAGELVNLLDSEGNVVLSFSPSKSYSHVVISSPDLAEESYTLVSGGENDGTSISGYYQGGNLSGGTTLGELSITDTIVDLTSSGETATTTGIIGGMPPQ